MSEPHTPPDSLGGPLSRPSGDGLPAVDGGREPPGPGDAVDPGLLEGDGDRGVDTPGQIPGA
ncbi:MAG: hypothetical protein JNK30_01660 [Phenylobacterium sp.]|uniref:hypothetical protein n=1 Tax=Phenylobacterium sp. TaxID=1871053 RepID=UPI001A408FA4|nr:hypothetical protein [Phenylobacterium sp.]MBL8770062.1 hypothetical protein [Phenylobacterium sp.]